jgi:hypothetical protein
VSIGEELGLIDDSINFSIISSPYLSSPVKQKVQAFEKHAFHTVPTPEKYKATSSKYVSPSNLHQPYESLNDFPHFRAP